MNSTQQRPYAIDLTIENRPGGGAYGTEVMKVWAYSAEDAVYQIGIQLARQRRRYFIDGVRPDSDSAEGSP